MNKILAILLIFSIIGPNQYAFANSTLAAVVLAGGVVKAQHIDITKKYKRKDCPVCKGKGWYISGDGISKVSCGYCEPNTESEIRPEIIIDPSPNKHYKTYRK